MRPQRNPQSYWGPYLDQQETSDLIERYVESHMVFIFQGIPPAYLERTIGQKDVLAVESAYADNTKLVFKYWYPGAQSTVPSLLKSAGGRVYGYVAFLSVEGLERFDKNLGTEFSEPWHKRVRTLVTLPHRPQPNRVRAWSYRISKPSWAPRKKRRYVPRQYKQAMADMLNEAGWKHDDGTIVTWQDVEEGQSPVRRNPMRVLQGAENLWGALSPDIQERLENFFLDPSAVTWDNIYSILIRPFKTVWQAVVAVDPTFPCSAAAGYDATPEERWPVVPDPFLVGRAIRAAIEEGR